MLDECRYRPRRISQKHTLQLCKATATLSVCAPDLKAPDLHWTIRDLRKILIHVVCNFRESFIEWFAD